MSNRVFFGSGGMRQRLLKNVEDGFKAAHGESLHEMAWRLHTVDDTNEIADQLLEKWLQKEGFPCRVFFEDNGHGSDYGVEFDAEEDAQRFASRFG